MKLIKVAPTEAVCDEPVELILLADNLPGADDLQVVFSGNNWEKKVSVLPDNLHYKKALSIYSPSLSEIKNKTKVSIYLERKGNGTITKPLDFYFFPPRKQEFGLPFKDQSLLEGNLNLNIESTEEADDDAGNITKTHGCEEPLNNNDKVGQAGPLNHTTNNYELTSNEGCIPSR